MLCRRKKTVQWNWYYRVNGTSCNFCIDEQKKRIKIQTVQELVQKKSRYIYSMEFKRRTFTNLVALRNTMKKNPIYCCSQFTTAFVWLSEWDRGEIEWNWGKNTQFHRKSKQVLPIKQTISNESFYLPTFSIVFSINDDENTHEHAGEIQEKQIIQRGQ